MALKEKPKLTTDAVVSGQLYVVAVPGNENGKVVKSTINGTVAQLLSNLGLSGSTVVKDCDVVGRATGTFVGPGDRGLDVFE